MFNLQPTVVVIDPYKPMFNLGACLDLPTGEYVIGKYGESILNGGLGALTGVVGGGNSFKSTILHFMMLQTLARIIETVASSIFTYDTEINIHENALRRFVARFPELTKEGFDIFNNGVWKITDKTIYLGNEFYELLKDFLYKKIAKENKEKFMYETPFLDRDQKSLLKIMVPTYGEIDSLTDFQTADVIKMQDENELGDSGGNTLHLRQGLAKTRLLSELPTLCGKTNHYLGITAQLGKDISINAGPMAPPPVKKLHDLKNGDKLKGVSDKFYFLMNNCWHSYSTTRMITKDGTPEYPDEGDTANSEIGTDLNLVKLRQLRSKSGPSGIVVELVVSQTEGVLPSLTEFHFIKNAERFGITGSLQHYSLDIYPDVKVSRTTVRTKIDADPLLCRALNITSELLQMKQLWSQKMRGLICTPKELYDDLIALGYDWDKILKSRGWWTLNNDKHPIPFLSTMDLLRIRKGLFSNDKFKK